MKNKVAVLVLWLGGLAAVLPAPGATETPDIKTRPSHPRLLLDQKDLQALKLRIAQPAWSDRWAKYKGDVDKALARPVELSPRGGNWSHNYVCPDHGARLKQGKQIGPWQWEHICPIGKHVLRGDPAQAHLDFDGNGISAAHGRLARLLIDAGVVYQVTGDRRYADQSREILLAYTAKYLTYPRHDNKGRAKGGGHIASQSLTEASWLIDMAQGTDLAWDALTEEQRRAAQEKMFLPALEQIIIRSKLGIHNIQCRHNAAIGLVGFLYGDDRLIRLAIDDPQRGFRQQILQGVRDDGMWCEGASGYHFFTIDGLWPLAEAARHAELNLYDARFKSMFDGPLALATPSLTLPNFNDSGTVSLVGNADLYELAYARWHDPRYLPLVNAGRRKGDLALWYGVAQRPAGTAAAGLGSRNSPASGYAILECGTGSAATWLCLKYGPHGGGHGHYDKNHFILQARGLTLMPDGGTHAYGSPLHGSWDQTSLAHNTLVADEKTQARAEGRSLAFGATPAADFSVTEAGAIYPGVRFVRTVALLNEKLIVVVDQVRSEQEHVFDIACHLTGAWKTLPAGAPWTPPAVTGYRHIAGATLRASPASQLFSTVPEQGAETALTVAGGEPTQFIAGTGIGASTEDHVPVLLLRRKAQSTAFVWALALDGQPVTLETLPVQAADGKPLATAVATAVQVRAGDKQWKLLVNPEKQAVLVNLPGDGWRSSEPFAVETR